MKRIYIKPHTSLVQINLIGSVLEDLGVNGGSNQGNYEDALSKQHNDFFGFDEEETRRHSFFNKLGRLGIVVFLI